MHLVLFGANGPTGRQLTDQALAGGHRVTAVTRHPGSMSPREGLTIVRAMFTARADLAACMLACLTGEQPIRKVISVSTTAATPGLIQQIWREVIRKPKKG